MRRAGSKREATDSTCPRDRDRGPCRCRAGPAGLDRGTPVRPARAPGRPRTAPGSGSWPRRPCCWAASSSRSTSMWVPAPGSRWSRPPARSAYDADGVASCWTVRIRIADGGALIWPASPSWCPKARAGGATVQLGERAVVCLREIPGPRPHPGRPAVRSGGRRDGARAATTLLVEDLDLTEPEIRGLPGIIGPGSGDRRREPAWPAGPGRSRATGGPSIRPGWAWHARPLPDVESRPLSARPGRDRLGGRGRRDDSFGRSDLVTRQ